MTLSELNQLPPDERKAALATCCGSTVWVDTMAGMFPFETVELLLERAESIWMACSEADWREAFTHHPKIGDINSLRAKFAHTKGWAAGEQAGVASASQRVLEDLAEGNRLYEEKFGYIFIICATGKSAGDMLDSLNARLPNAPETEIRIAMREQGKITTYDWKNYWYEPCNNPYSRYIAGETGRGRTGYFVPATAGMDRGCAGNHQCRRSDW